MTATDTTPTKIDLQELVAEADTGRRKPAGVAGKILASVAIAWSLFQLWYASPLPFMLGFGIFSDTEARVYHLCFALFITFAAYPAYAGASRTRIPLYDWLIAALGIASALYLVVFYNDIALRPGLPTRWDIIAACASSARRWWRNAPERFSSSIHSARTTSTDSTTC